MLVQSGNWLSYAPYIAALKDAVLRLSNIIPPYTGEDVESERNGHHAAAVFDSCFTAVMCSAIN